MTDVTEVFNVLQASVVRLRNLVEGLTDDQLRAQAYPTEWTVADVLSHLGSGAEIMRLRIEEAVTERELPDGFAQPIWDTWNAKSPGAKAADALAADRAFVERVESLTTEEGAAVHIDFGPVQVDLAGAVAARLNDHALHTWDVDVTLDPAATIPVDAATVVVDNLELIARFSGKPIGEGRDLRVRTWEPARDFTLTLGPDAVALTPGDDAHDPDVELPAEAFIRLVYGRLDSDHTPDALAGVDLSALRGVFRGV